MSALPWVDLAALVGNNPVIEAYLDDLHNNQEALITQQLAYNFAEVTEAGAAYVTKVNQEAPIPPAVATLQGEVLLEVRFEAWVTGGGTGKVQVRLGSGAYVESIDIVVAAPGTTISVIIPDAHVKAAIGLSSLETQLKMVSGGGTLHVRYNGGATQLRREA
jgi:hypothetical protein